MIRDIKFYRHRFLSVVGIVVGSLCVVSIGASMKPMRSERKLVNPNKNEGLVLINGVLSSLSKATSWINSSPLKNADLKGKVVLIEFWTYSCINWRRTLPYVRAWSTKYKDQGLVVIGVHAPEFDFEKSVDNVLQATMDMRIDYPVAIDNNFEIWRSFNNNYWPALYFIDAKGHIRYSEFGEGKYNESEKLIQQLLIESGATQVNTKPVAVDARGAEVAADWNNLKSAENYVGYERSNGFASPDGIYRDKSREYSVPVMLSLNEWALSGNWKIEKQSILLNSTSGKIVYRFHARDLHVVLGPIAKGNSLRFRVLIDGKSPGTSHGSDIDSLGNGVVNQQRMYHLIRQPLPINDKLIEIEFLDSGLEAFVFTFG